MNILCSMLNKILWRIKSITWLPIQFNKSKSIHDDVIKWKHFPRYWPFVREIHRSPANSSHKGQWRGALMFSLICALNKGLSKQWWGWWFETPSRPLRRHCNELFFRLLAPSRGRQVVVNDDVSLINTILCLPWKQWNNYIHRILWSLYILLTSGIPMATVVIMA